MIFEGANSSGLRFGFRFLLSDFAQPKASVD